jgi:hypothetical protein
MRFIKKILFTEENLYQKKCQLGKNPYFKRREILILNIFNKGFYLT